jgi:hypothetical protein
MAALAQADPFAHRALEKLRWYVSQAAVAPGKKWDIAMLARFSAFAVSDEDRYILCRYAAGQGTGSSRDLTLNQCKGIWEWLGAVALGECTYGAAAERIAAAVRAAEDGLDGQQGLPGLDDDPVLAAARELGAKVRQMDNETEEANVTEQEQGGQEGPAGEDQQEEVGKATGDGLVFTELSALYQRKWNMGNYETADVGLNATVTVEPGADAEAVCRALFDWLREQVKRESLPLIEGRKANHAPAQPAAGGQSGPSGPAAPGPQAQGPTGPAQGPQGPAQGPQGPGGGGDDSVPPWEENPLRAERLIVTAPRGKAVIEFWLPDGKHPAAKWYTGGAKLLEIAPTMVPKGVTAAWLDQPGSEWYQPMLVHWAQSPKNPRWKDITKVEVV